LLFVFVGNASRKEVSSDLRTKSFKRILTDVEISGFYYEPEKIFFLNRGIQSLRDGDVANAEIGSKNLYIRFFICLF
jgi:hypothetical protein